MWTNSDIPWCSTYEGNLPAGISFKILLGEPADWHEVLRRRGYHDVQETDFDWRFFSDGWRAYAAYGNRAIAGAVPLVAADPLALAPPHLDEREAWAWGFAFVAHQDELIQRVGILGAMSADIASKEPTSCH